jgi:hypothetical protein
VLAGVAAGKPAHHPLQALQRPHDPGLDGEEAAEHDQRQPGQNEDESQNDRAVGFGFEHRPIPRRHDMQQLHFRAHFRQHGGKGRLAMVQILGLRRRDLRRGRCRGGEGDGGRAGRVEQGLAVRLQCPNHGGLSFFSSVMAA